MSALQADGAGGLPVTLACELGDGDAEPTWLIEGLWSEAAVGVLGGEPKCCKSFLALDAAVSVASGRPCLRSFAVHRAGPVLVFPAEDSHAVVRRRLDAIAAAAGLSLRDLPVHVITAAKVMLDSRDDRRRLEETVAAIKPVLLVLDPFIRMHAADENAASEVAPLLGYLRELQRRHDVAIMLVHHARKDARGARPGQALRGSSDLHGWGDSNLYLRRLSSGLRLSIEHRAAPGRDNIPLELAVHETRCALRVMDDGDASIDEPAASDPADRIIEALSASERPLQRRELKECCPMRAATFCSALRALIASHRVARTRDGRYRLSGDDASAPVPVPVL
jgi:hypothetical protein